jgi:sugar/nucleoside kinase (ribokinase family)
VATLPFRFPADRPFDVVGLGENSVDYLCVLPHHPAPAEKMRIEQYEVQGGGQIATAMVACRRLGLRARYLGKVGDDLQGRLAIDELRAEGVDTSSVRVQRGSQSRIAFILVDRPSGERTVLWTHDGALEIDEGELTREQVTSGRVLHLDATSPRAAVAAARMARAGGTVTCIDLDHVPACADELLPLIDLCILSSHVPTALTGERDRQRALLATRRFCPDGFLCVTLGAEGCMALVGNDIIHVPGFAVTAVDTTACGDVFHAAFIYAALAGFDIARALRFSNATAALKTRKLGGRPGIPTLGEVEQFLARHPE